MGFDVWWWRRRAWAPGDDDGGEVRRRETYLPRELLPEMASSMIPPSLLEMSPPALWASSVNNIRTFGTTSATQQNQKK